MQWSHCVRSEQAAAGGERQMSTTLSLPFPGSKNVATRRRIRQVYGGAAPRVRKSDTSCAAADSITPRLGAMHFSVLNIIRKAGGLGLTCDEVEELLGYRHQTASARIRELYLGGYIRDSFLRRMTRSNRTAVVWVAI